MWVILIFNYLLFIAYCTDFQYKWGLSSARISKGELYYIGSTLVVKILRIIRIQTHSERTFAISFDIYTEGIEDCGQFIFQIIDYLLNIKRETHKSNVGVNDRGELASLITAKLFKKNSFTGHSFGKCWRRPDFCKASRRLENLWQ